ncbi:MAG: serine/threonine protein kinase, partial [Myxococcales bacterium]|nr:serine/threonine protein kinase [Myxococcales bacterium]
MTDEHESEPQVAAETWLQRARSESDELARARTRRPDAAAEGGLGSESDRIAAMVRARLFPSLAKPVRIGRYTVLDRLGQGGMGVVYSAYDPELDRKVAIKILRGERGDVRGNARLVREAKAMARVAHPNVIAVIEVGEHEGHTFVVMEYLRGKSLDEWITGARSWREIVAVYAQAGRGLAAAHQAGVVHRDFKPHNAMIIEGGVDDGRVKVLDFGLARAREELTQGAEPLARGAGVDASLTRTGAIMGTPLYMAPEQYLGLEADARSDQYSFGVSLHEALYGQLPYTAGELAELRELVLAGQYAAPERGADVPPWVLRVLRRALSREPEARYPSMHALCEALERDPTARRRRVAVTASLVAAACVGSWAIARAGVDASRPCAGPEFTLEDVWSAGPRARMHESFARPGRASALETLARVEARLDVYATGWREQRREACEQHRAGLQSDELLDLRMRCLDLRRASFTALVDVFAAADDAVISRAAEASYGLPELSRCADAAALRSAVPLPEDGARARGVQAARRALEGARVLTSAGRYRDALAGVDEVYARAGALEYPPLRAEAALARGLGSRPSLGYPGDKYEMGLAAIEEIEVI